jgi:tetratricopeptide (TPR) repeat protein
LPPAGFLALRCQRDAGATFMPRREMTLRPALLFCSYLGALCWLLSCAPAQQQVSIGFPPSHKLIVLSVPDKPVALQIDLRQLSLQENTLRPDGAGARLLAHDASWTLSAFAYPVESVLTAQALREQEWGGLRKAPVKAMQVKTSERGATALLEYFVESFQGKNIQQKNVVAYRVSGNQGFEVHISKVGYSPDDDVFFNAFLDAIKLLENFQPDSRDRFRYGSFFYLQKNWPRAIEQYEKALDLERTKKALPQAEWRVLVDNLGMAYGISGDLQRAKRMFEFGITQDPEYPMFHYNLACSDAELNDLDNALQDLRAAFRYRANSIPGEGMPDPAKDSSFEKYMNDPRFKAEAQQLCPSSRETASGFICE